MHQYYIIDQLDKNAAVFRELLAALTPEECTWKQEPEKWCLLEIACHLRDEEREDFRARLNHVLAKQEGPMPAIDPPGWVTERNYMGQAFDNVLSEFLAERNDSVTWLKSLRSPDWTAAYDHPKLGKMDGNLFLSNWLAHDLLHFRQITRLRFEYLRHISGQNLSYAGVW